MYIFCRFNEVSAIKKPKIITSSKTGSQIFFADFVFFYQNETIFRIPQKPLTLGNTDQDVFFFIHRRPGTMDKECE